MIAKIDSPTPSTPPVGQESDAGFSSPYQVVTELGEFVTTDDIAVVGMACRVAGDNNSPEQLWQSILEKKDASGEIPSMRWEPYLRRDVRNVKEISKTTSKGYFLKNLEDFDAAFFGISPKEAEQMDPQQRLSLEVAWEALEDAGIDPKTLSGSDTAVFMGVNSDDYSKLLLEDLPNVEAWMGIGTAYCGVPNRISYHLNLMGPSTAVDAACASSLVAIHHGRQAILLGESKVAIVGGVNALCGPGLTRVLDKAGAISPDGSCLSFDDDAHGYGRGEGAAVIILKRLENALVDGDHIIALLKGSAVAQDGKTNGIMAPNAKAQELVARQALERAKVDPLTVGYIEAHATSTPLGDPTEVSAISAVYGRHQNGPVSIGSVKPNVGHLEAGAGAVGFIKAVMAMNKGQFPPQANLKKLNSKIDWEKSGTRVVRDLEDWYEPNGPRRAAVCSYGYGGTVSHAIMEQTPRDFLAQFTAKEEGEPSGPILLVLSAPQEKRLTLQATSYEAWISSAGKKESLRAISNTMSTRRTHHDYRAAFVVDDHEDAADLLKAFSQGAANEWISQSRTFGSDIGAVWVFSGHGAQWEGMGQDLLKNVIFKNAVSAIDGIVLEEVGYSAITALETGDFAASDKVQVLTYVMQIGIAAVLRSTGLTPQAIIGHSVGEIAASVVAGCLKPEEGALIVTRRAKLYAQVKGLGAMILANLPFSDVAAELGDRRDLVAAIASSPSSCVVSGEAAAVAAYADSLKLRGVKTFNVKTDIAFHCPMLEQLAVPLSKSLLKCLNPRPAVVPLYSTSESNPRSVRLRDIEYWVNNMVKPVLLNSAVSAALEDGFRLFLEVSTHPIVSHSINETLMDKGLEEDFAVIPTVVRNKPAEKSILHAAAQLYTRGHQINFKTHHGRGSWSPGVPGTQWSHKPIWRKIETGPLSAGTTHDVDKHTLLGLRTAVAGTNTTAYTTKLDNATKPFPGNHPLHGTEIVPAAVLVNTFHHATGASVLSNIVLRVPVAINAPRDVQVVVQDDQVKIVSRLQQSSSNDENSWVTHTTGEWSAAKLSEDQTIKFDVEEIRKRIGTALANDFSKDYLDKVGVSAMGFPWAITEHYGNLKEMIARVDVAPDVASDAVLPWDAHSWASLLDAATSVGSTIFFDDPKLRMPAQIDKVFFFTSNPPPKTAHLYVEEASNKGPAVHVSVLSDEGDLLAKFESMRFAEIEGTPGASGSTESLVHQLQWMPATLSDKPILLDQMILLSDDATVLDTYGTKMKRQAKKFIHLHKAKELAGTNLPVDLKKKGSAIVYIPGQVKGTLDDVPSAAEEFIAELLDTVKFVATSALPTKVFVMTDRVFDGESPTALAQAPLQGLARIIASEHPDLWGALIDNEDPIFPTLAAKYVQEQDIVRMEDGMPRVARLRPLPREMLHDASSTKTLLPKPEGTYIITGGIGALGLEVADFLVEKGARRVVLVSRRGLPPRDKWNGASNALAPAAVIEKIQLLEKAGATVHVVSLDIGASDADVQLSQALKRLSLPPVLGVVHAAGVLEDQLVLETTADSFARVLSPKVSGALALHKAFPPATLDFFVLFSSCGQLFGFPGQSSYASGNAFLDTLATHRRMHGDNAVAFQWTSWHGMGMAASTDFISAELQSKGITDVSRDEAFRAWEHVSKYDVDHGVVLRSLAFDEGEPLPVPILEHIAVRRIGTSAPVAATEGGGADSMPTSGPELKAWLDAKIRDCVASVLMLSSADEVDSRAAISDLGVDSVMTVTLRRKLQSVLKVKVPPTLTWSHPTVNHLVGWFAEKLGGGK